VSISEDDFCSLGTDIFILSVMEGRGVYGFRFFWLLLVVTGLTVVVTVVLELLGGAVATVSVVLLPTEEFAAFVTEGPTALLIEGFATVALAGALELLRLNLLWLATLTVTLATLSRR